MNPQIELNNLLQQHGAVLVRGKKHRVYRLRNGHQFYCSTTPSDVRAAHKQLADLKRILGITKTEMIEGVRRDRKQGKGPAEPKLRLNSVNASFAEQLQVSGVVERHLREQLAASEDACQQAELRYAQLQVRHAALELEHAQMTGELIELWTENQRLKAELAASWWTKLRKLIWGGRA